MPLEAGTQLGPKARDTRLDRTVAIKVLPEHVASDPDLKQRFEREAKTISSLNHPHICTLYDIGSQNGIDFLVMEYLEGDTLAQRLEKGALPLDQALQVAIQIADALDKAHRQGITHRDLKLGNIMLTKVGAKLRPARTPPRFRPARARAPHRRPPCRDTDRDGSARLRHAPGEHPIEDQRMEMYSTTPASRDRRRRKRGRQVAWRSARDRAGETARVERLSV